MTLGGLPLVPTMETRLKAIRVKFIRDRPLGLGLGLGFVRVRIKVRIRVSDPRWIASSAHHGNSVKSYSCQIHHAITID